MNSDAISSLHVDIFRLFNNEWGLLTAGPMADHNAMTISWGQLGSLWGGPGHAKNIVTVFVKPVRYTFTFMERHDLFTICWFPKDFRKDLGILGSKSGRDGDKLALTRLTPKAVGEGVGYEQATLTLLCRKLYSDQLKKERIPADAVAAFYSGDDGVDPHHMYIGEILYMEQQA
ncbi:MAG: hypothetical protein IJU65_03685 [Desulfovibrio sp.]|nr:hypothetical protein [Desulfovibrio sp.]